MYPRLSLASSPSGAILSFYSSSISLGDEMAMRFGFSQYTAHLYHSLEASQQGILGFTITYRDL